LFKKLSHFGGRGFTCGFGDEVHKNPNKGVIKLFYFFQESVNPKKIRGILNYPPSYNKLIINFELGQINSPEIIEFIKTSDYSKISLPENKKIVEFPICYDEEFALDIKILEKKTKLNFKEIVSKLLETNFFVYLIGFVPGQPFLGVLNKGLYHDRLDTPRVKINKGSVGIVEKFCTIYTFESPGGWNIIGRTPFELFNINKKNTSILSPGDTVKFKPISKKEFGLFGNE
jgi:Allophanate hydrolase subunit 1